jgi:ectoine hydroxylase-related dioxygenase (phytanoyl-CoA dioxygenase family)
VNPLPHDPQPTADILTDVQIAAFERDGFVTIDQLADADEVASWCDGYDELFARAGGFADNDRIDLAPAGERSVLPQIVNPERYLPQLVEGRAYANARAVARQLLGDDAVAMGNHAINKPGGDGAPTPWHQDEAYWDQRFDHQAISIWIPLQDVAESNGCMVFVPGSHHGEVLPHRLIHADSHGLQLVDGDEPPGAVACPLPAGGATVHAGRTLHYAGPNRTSEARRAVVFAFARPATPRAEPHDYRWQRPEWYSSDS